MRCTSPRPMQRWRMLLICLLGVLPVVVRGLAAEPGSAVPFDILIRGGTVYDGSGRPPRRADVAVRGDQVVAIGDLVGAAAKSVADANGLAVAPGFINMLSWSNESLLVDGRGQSEVRQGVTTQILGEGWSMGPVNAAIKKALCREAKDDRAWLNKVRPMFGHDYHFHIRIKCPADSADCKPQDPIPAGDGCGDLQGWFKDSVIHPKPEPPPKEPPSLQSGIKLAQLPRDCKGVLNAPDAKVP